MDDFPLSVVQTNLTDQWKVNYSVDTLQGLLFVGLLPEQVNLRDFFLIICNYF